MGDVLVAGQKFTKKCLSTELKLRTHSKITSHFSIPASGCLCTILITQSPQNSLLFLRLCAIGSYKFNLNLSANSVNLFLSEPLKLRTYRPSKNHYLKVYTSMSSSAFSLYLKIYTSCILQSVKKTDINFQEYHYTNNIILKKNSIILSG